MRFQHPITHLKMPLINDYSTQLTITDSVDLALQDTENLRHKMIERRCYHVHN